MPGCGRRWSIVYRLLPDTRQEWEAASGGTVKLAFTLHEVVIFVIG
ncbi:hypothetical protein AWB69_03413 [Caballeronia udeis]|uniref:Uncharacterized protein n=1 Tax=Caballeronia udeis TaxID=1232866 RepID=A0A158GV72_9BURK|nr:hypothetical protein AWB69_03413 [Caballeronia udeis]